MHDSYLALMHLSKGISVLAIGFILSGCNTTNRERTVKIMGSDSEVNLVLHLAEAYTAIDSVTSIGIIGGGSGMGIASLINGKAHIANSSRGLTASENKLCQDRDLDVRRIIFAKDAIAFVVHQSNPLDTLTLSLLSSILRGEISQWSEVQNSLEPKKVRMYGRQTNSGTYLYVKDSIVKGEYSNTFLGLNGNAQIIEALRQDPSGIGYVSAGYLNDHTAMNQDIKVLWLKAYDHSTAFSPMDAEAVIAMDYPVVRPLIQFVSKKVRKSALDFIAFELSEAGQHVVQSSGYYPLSAAEKEASLKQISTDHASTQR